MTSAGKGRPTGREPFPPDARLPGTDKNRDQPLSLRLSKAARARPGTEAERVSSPERRTA